MPSVWASLPPLWASTMTNTMSMLVAEDGDKDRLGDADAVRDVAGALVLRRELGAARLDALAADIEVGLPLAAILLVVAGGPEAADGRVGEQPDEKIFVGVGAAEKQLVHVVDVVEVLVPQHGPSIPEKAPTPARSSPPLPHRNGRGASEKSQLRLVETGEKRGIRPCGSGVGRRRGRAGRGGTRR